MDNTTVHMLQVEDRRGRTQRKNQYIAAVAAAISAFIAGTALEWTFPALRQFHEYYYDYLRQNMKFSGIVTANISSVRKSLTKATIDENTTRDLVLSENQQRLFASILLVGALVGALPVGVMAQKIGRRSTLLMLSVPFLLYWLLTIFANGAVMLVTARFIGGIATGGVCVAAPIYISEIAQTDIRGSLGAFFQLFLTVGRLFTFVVGSHTTWRQLSIICAVFCPILVAVFWWMPETPQYLLVKNRRRDAERALRWLRGPSADISSELEEMQKEIDDGSRNRGGALSMVTNGTSLMALVCSLGLMFFQQFSGIDFVTSYFIFLEMRSYVSQSLAHILVLIVKTIATFMSCLLVEAGRRILLLQSCIIMGGCLVVLGIYFTLQNNNTNVTSFGWVPLLCMVLLNTSFSLGLEPIPWVMMAELFAVQYRGMASGITVMTKWYLVILINLNYDMVYSIGIYPYFFFFSVYMVICVFFVCLVIPETKGKTNAQIQAILAGY